jgi:hypothetical protein
MTENKYNIIFEKLEELSRESERQEDLGGDSNTTRIEYDEISELCKLSLETKDENPCLFTTT